jgi:hypothetical protein
VTHLVGSSYGLAAPTYEMLADVLPSHVRCFSVLLSRVRCFSSPIGDVGRAEHRRDVGYGVAHGRGAEKLRRLPDEMQREEPVDETCPISTEGWTRRVHFVREGGEGGLPAAPKARQPRRGGAWHVGGAAGGVAGRDPPCEPPHAATRASSRWGKRRSASSVACRMSATSWVPTRPCPARPARRRSQRAEEAESASSHWLVQRAEEPRAGGAVP